MGDNRQTLYTKERIAHWDSLAIRMDGWKGWGTYYHQRLTQIYQFLVPPGCRVLEVGCGLGDTLASLKPGCGVGIDFSSEMIQRARQRHPELSFVESDAHGLNFGQTFDVIILSDVVNDMWDVQLVLRQLLRLCHPSTRIIMNFYSHLWEAPLKLTQRLGLAKPMLPQSWLTMQDISNLLHLEHYEIIRQWEEVLWPLNTPLLAGFANHYLVKCWPLNLLALTHFVVARQRPQPGPTDHEPLVSVIVPARNEAGNIPQVIRRIPEMGAGTEIVFVEGHSSDATYEAIHKAVTEHPSRRCKVLQQTGKGKGDAVRLGFAEASGNIFMILDADMTVPPEELPKFHEVLRSGGAEFVNGCRLVYPLEKQSMRFLNLLANKLFGLIFSWLLGQPVKDTLCGTKALTRENYLRIAENRTYFGNFDPFGDFDLLFGAAKLNLQIRDLPIRYRERTYGSTNIQRWEHGWLLLKMVLFAARKIKFL
jgi:SAM-dependent methyltransferase